MDDSRGRDYPPGEESYYQNREKLTPVPPAPRLPYRRLITIFASVIGVMLVIMVIMAALLIHMVTTPQSGGISGAQPISSAAPTAVATSALQQPAPTPTATPTPGATLPCNVSVGTWAGGSPDWKPLNGTLLNDGSNTFPNLDNGPTLVAPCQLGNVTDYAVEAKIQVTSGHGCFGITVRGSTTTNGWQGYMAGAGDCAYYWENAYIGGPGYSSDSSDVKASFDPGTNSHTYRVEAKGNTIILLIDGSPLLTLNDNRYLTGSQVGLWSAGVQLQITSFEVTAL